MRTSIDIPDKLFQRAKVTAAQRGVTLKHLIIEGLEKTLPDQAVKPDASRLPTLPTSGRKPYNLSNQEIEEILVAEERSCYGNS